jgi:hypothetical protein
LHRIPWNAKASAMRPLPAIAYAALYPWQHCSQEGTMLCPPAVSNLCQDELARFSWQAWLLGQPGQRKMKHCWCPCGVQVAWLQQQPLPSCWQRLQWPWQPQPEGSHQPSPPPTVPCNHQKTEGSHRARQQLTGQSLLNHGMQSLVSTIWGQVLGQCRQELVLSRWLAAALEDDLQLGTQQLEEVHCKLLEAMLAS